MEWIDGDIGSKVTMKYPSIFLVGSTPKSKTLLGGVRRPQPARTRMRAPR